MVLESCERRAVRTAANRAARLAAQSEYELVAEDTFEDGVMASLAVVGNSLIVLTRSGSSAWDNHQETAGDISTYHFGSGRRVSFEETG